MGFSMALMPACSTIIYSVLEGRNQVLPAVETMDEILADKLIALPASIPGGQDAVLESASPRIRYRNICIAWLSARGARLNTQLVMKKITDYGVPNYSELLDRAITEMPTLARGVAFWEHTSRFSPRIGIVRCLKKPTTTAISKAA